jgi:hypothetical protein
VGILRLSLVDLVSYWGSYYFYLDLGFYPFKFREGILIFLPFYREGSFF